jgi:intracellular sulfur oxidation DsrE/DsrF family protein
VFAQDVQQVLPEAVVFTGSSLAVKYNALIPLVIEAIREINNKMTSSSVDVLAHTESVELLEKKLKSVIESHELSKRRISELEEAVRLLQSKVK